MDFRFICDEKITTSYEVKEVADGISVVHLSADKTDDSVLMGFTFYWEIPAIEVHALWSPGRYTDKTVVPSWGIPADSCEMSNAPIYSALDYHDRNRQTIACSDAQNRVMLMSGVNETFSVLECTVGIYLSNSVNHYETDIRIDRRDIPFYEAVEDCASWFEAYNGYAPAPVPDCAKKPLYSTWYSYHRNIDTEAITSDCAFFNKLGTDVMILDDGWQTSNYIDSYGYSGDWIPDSNKIHDMRAFVEAVHSTGTKFMLWYSVPFISENAKAYESLRGKILYSMDETTHILDPRYPEVRALLINCLRNAVIDWNLDGFKLDFIDWFKHNDNVKDGMDYASVYEAVDRLMKDILRSLRELKPDILIEFRQTYIGPLMRTYGNMFRSSDCPNDSLKNRLNTLSLRMTSGNTAVHSDMVMWNYSETVEQAAFQLTNVLFAVPQISVRHKDLPAEHCEMIGAYLKFWTKYRDVLMNGKMRYCGYTSDFPFVSAKSADTEVCAIYSGMIAYLEEPSKEIAIVNATLEHRILFDLKKGSGSYNYTVYDCMGREVGNGNITITDDGKFEMIADIPTNGVVIMNLI